VGSNIHANIVLKMGVVLLSTQHQSVLDIGAVLNKAHTDDLTSGGYWLYDWITNECYYSDNFIASMGYDRSEVSNKTDFFYKVANKEHLNHGFDMIYDLIKEMSETCFINELDYTRKNGEIIKIQCSGTVFYKFGEPIIVLGTHKII